MFEMNPILKYLVLVFIAFICVLFVFFFLHYVPFYLFSYCFWIGVIILCIGCLSVIRPIQKISLNTRMRSSIFAASGGLLVAFALVWPSSISTSRSSQQKLDTYLPQYQSVEYHEGRVRLPIEKVIEASRTVTLMDMPIAVLFMKIRALAVGERYQPDLNPKPLLDTESNEIFIPLDVLNPNELVFGMVGKLNEDDSESMVFTPDQFNEFNQSGYMKVAFNFRILDEGDGVVRISTETRVLCMDNNTQTRFSRYWRIIYPGSAIIRRLWIDAIIDKAQRL